MISNPQIEELGSLISALKNQLFSKNEVLIQYSISLTKSQLKWKKVWKNKDISKTTSIVLARENLKICFVFRLLQDYLTLPAAKVR